ncbi:MAG TPA: precorrin-6y C5,15-methyltransferase (decarboxylating) subunit CbiE [Acidimicrobiales bacterium]|nr:precorrin-6y C5,15-methyltransferase (decarboxylating) subunit CbiE [Acidimicrobiales bacterium]
MRPPVLLVGAGPGDPDLLTVRAEQALAAAATVVTDAAVADLATTFAPAASIVEASGDPAALVAAARRDGEPLVRLYRGDPWLHPDLATEAAALAAAGIAAEPVAGIVPALAAAAEAGRPVHHRPVSVAVTLESADALRPGPVHVVGLLGGRPVGAAAEAAVRAARLVAGGAEQLAAVADLLAPGTETATVAAGLAALDRVAAHPSPAVVLASGDPGFHGITRALAGRVGAGRLVVHPAPSSVALAFARLGLAWDAARVTSCHAGDAAGAAAQVARAPLAAVLCGPAAPPQALGAALVALGAHHPTVVVATRLGEPGEAVHRLGGVADLAAGAFDHRSVVVLAHPDPPVAAAARTGGRPVSDFHHRAGMITKPAVRSVVLGHLDLPDRGVLWDVGAGSGSVAIEAALAAPGLQVIAVERDPAAVEAIVANAAALGAVVEVVAGEAPAALAGLPRPDRVFVGGGGLAALDAALAAAAPGARVVATYAAVDRALVARRRLGELAQVAVDRAVDLPGGGVRFVADNPVFVAWGTAGGDEGEDGGRIAVGVGCSSGATAAQVAEATDAALAAAGLDGRRPDVVATIDRRADHAAVAAAVTFPASLLAAVDVPHPSDAVEAAVGTPSVAEAAALLAAGPGARLLAAKHVDPDRAATAAVARGPARATAHGRVVVVGLGPGGSRHRTPAAAEAVRGADAVVGYAPYVDAAAPLLRPDQMVVRSAMGAEAARAGEAVALAAAGWRVAVVSSGDPGVFAMASVTLEEAAARGVPVEVVPGVTAAQAAAAAVGAPLAAAHAAVSLSDLLVPWATIEAQLRAAAASGMALALFNPRSAGRPDHLARAAAVLAEVLDGATPVAVVSDATGPGERVVVGRLDQLDPTAAGMRSLVLVGTADTAVLGGRVVTRRHHPRPEPVR